MIAGTTIATRLEIMRIAALILVLFGTACRPASDTEAPGSATIAVMDDIEAGMPLDSMLALLEHQLELAHEGRLDGQAFEEYRIAEAISDRLLEARVPFEWLNAEDYSVQSRLRQIQSSADRVLAQAQANMGRDTVMSELQQLQEEVVGLRRSIAAGGRRAPPSISRLLSDSTGAGREPASSTSSSTSAPSRSGPIGTPVSRPDSIQPY